MKPFEKINYKVGLLVFIFSVVLISLFSKASPFYPINDLPDSNTWLLQARMVLDGKIPYRDIYEHKGPIQFFLYLFAALPCFSRFHGLYLTEILLYFINGCIFYAAARIFLSENKSLISAILAMFMVSAVSAFSNTGCSEELLLFSFSFPVMIFYKRLTDGSRFTGRDTVLIGIMAALHFWTKYSMCLFDLILILYAVFYYRKNHWNILRDIFYYLFGFLLISSVVVFYFLLNDSLADLIDIYFYAVLFQYSGSIINSSDWPLILLNTIVLLFEALLAQPELKNEKERFLFLSFFSLLILWSRIFPGWPYYFLPLYAYAGIFTARMLWSGRALRKLFFLMAVIFVLNDNQAETLKYSKEEYGQLQVCSIISQDPDAKVALIDCPNEGFFVYSDSIPFMRYFAKYNIDTEAIRKERDELLHQKTADYIITGKELEEADHYGYRLILQTESPACDVSLFLGKKSLYKKIYLYEKDEAGTEKTQAQLENSCSSFTNYLL